MTVPVLVNFSSDAVYCIASCDTLIVPYRNLESTLPVMLHEFFKKHTPSAVVVMNGPGGFSALRIGSLVINLITQHYAIPLYDRNKIDFYRQFVVNGAIPQYGWIGIGQKNTLWLYDYRSDNYETVPLQQLDGVAERAWFQEKKYFIDMMQSHIFLEALDQNTIVTVSTSEQGVHLGDSLVGWSERTIPQKIVTTLTPRYMIDPTLG